MHVARSAKIPLSASLLCSCSTDPGSLSQLFSRISFNYTRDGCDGFDSVQDGEIRRWVMIEGEKDVREALVNECFDAGAGGQEEKCSSSNASESDEESSN